VSLAGGDAEGVRIEVLRGAPDEDELAALIAVVAEAYAGEAAEAVADDETSRTAWSLTQRNLREPLRRDIPWGRFAG
jgi:hypothetical protein